MVYVPILARREQTDSHSELVDINNLQSNVAQVSVFVNPIQNTGPKLADVNAVTSSSEPITSNRTQPAENSSPVVKSQEVSGVNNEKVFVTLQGEVADGDKLIFSIVSYPTHGTLVGFDSLTGKRIYKPDNEFNGVDSFSYKVTDQKRLSRTLALSQE